MSPARRTTTLTRACLIALTMTLALTSCGGTDNPLTEAEGNAIMDYIETPRADSDLGIQLASLKFERDINQDEADDRCENLLARVEDLPPVPNTLPITFRDAVNASRDSDIRWLERCNIGSLSSGLSIGAEEMGRLACFAREVTDRGMDIYELVCADE